MLPPGEYCVRILSIISLLNLINYYRTPELGDYDAKKVQNALEQYCLTEEAFPNDCAAVITTMIKKIMGKDINVHELSRLHRHQVCIIPLYHMNDFRRTD